MADADEKEDLKDTGAGSQSANTSSPKDARNPNPVWQKKIGRTSAQNNVYEISDVEETECGTSNEWCTPQSSANCGVCVMVMAVIGMVLMIYSLAIRINRWNLDNGNETCSTEDGESFTVSSKLAVTQIWEYWSAAILMASIISLLSGLYSFCKDRAYILDAEGHAKKEVKQWDVSNTRVCCRCQIFGWCFVFVLILVWFWMMVGIVSGLDQIANAKNCVPDSVTVEAAAKSVAFGFLITCSIIGGVCCALPMVCFAMCDRVDDESKHDQNDK